ncbi:MAG: hypothetical protein A2X94_04380 [Bdellovibrionales bacterium GWB1_55_8]|nr:MAG: hypothetical protein A2X94_04380 [Bdellovibrionales bacterium GWB1_55_8]
MSRPPISVTIITLNEESNIARAIRSASWADELLVVDSGSTDRTVQIASTLGARVLTNPWPGYGQQKNFGQKQARHDWVLNIDADEEISPELAAEIQTSLARIGAGESNASAFSFPRRTYYLSRWIRHGGWYPNVRVRMADRKKAAWTEPSVHEDLKVQGEIVQLQGALNHYSFPTIESQILTNLRFARLGSEALRNRKQAPSLLKLVVKPLGKFLETYFLKLGMLDGISGFIISVNAAHSMFLKYAYLFEPALSHENAPKREEAKKCES